jgi:hypothetical protein
VVNNMGRRLIALLLSLTLGLCLNEAGAFAYRGQQAGVNTGATDSGEPIAWHQRDVSMGLNFGAQWNDAARLALRQWNEAGADFNWHADSNSATPCVNDGINSTGWSERSCSGDWGSIIASTRVTMTRVGGTWYINDTDILFNSSLQYARYAGPQRYDADGRPVYDFIRVALHEFGHAAGLLHPNEAGQQVDAIMNSGSRSLNLDHLQGDDIQGLHRLYAGARGSLDIVFEGVNGYQIGAGRISVGLDTLRNRRARESGALTLEIRASTAGAGDDYYLLGRIELSRLDAGQQRSLGWLSTAYTPPPAGLHSLSLALVEDGAAATPIYRQAIGYLEMQSDTVNSAQSSAAPDSGGGPADILLWLLAVYGLGRRYAANN